MCTNCLPYRHTDHADRCCAPETALDTWGDGFAGYLRAPMSRARMLRTLGGGLALSLTAGLLGKGTAQAAGAHLPYVVLIVLDGARPGYFNVPGIPTLQSLIRNGTRYTNAFAGILESETPSGHVAIATGSEPRKTGIPSFWWADSANRRVSLFSPAKIRAGDMEKIIRQSGAPTLAGLVHAKHPKAAVVALSGSKYYAADAIGGPDANVTMYFQNTAGGQFVPTYIPGHAPPDGLLNNPGLVGQTGHLGLGVQNHLAMTLAVETFNRMRQKVTLINLPEFDWPLGHVNGGSRDKQSVTALMQSFDRDFAMLRQAYHKARVLHRTIFVLLADHGMMPLHNEVPKSDITKAVDKAGTRIVADAYTSGAYLWLQDKSRAGLAARNIANLGNPHIQTVYVKVRSGIGFAYARASSSRPLLAAGIETANQYLLQSFNGPNAPDVVVLFAEGVGSEPGGQSRWKADHGGASWQAQHIPLILAGPGIRSGYVSAYPARLIDVAPTILQAIGVPYQGMQGIALADGLTSVPPWVAQSQVATTRQLMPVITALQQQSHLELATRR